MDEKTMRGMWEAARRWLMIWAGAGFVGRVEGGKILFDPAIEQKFPDFKMVLGGLRPEIFGLIRDGNRAIPPDPARQRAYIEHLEAILADERKRLAHAEKCVRDSNKAICDLEIELAEARK